LFSSGIFFFVGPVLLVFAMVFEWIMGNFFPMMVMGLFAVFWLSFGMLQLPTLQLGAPYASAADPTGLLSREYNSAVALYLIVWGFALFTFFIFTCKINAVFAAIFLLVSVASWVLSGAYWKVSWGDYDAAARLQKASLAKIPWCSIPLLTLSSTTGWWRLAVHCGRPRLVHVLHHHGRRDAHHPAAPCWRSEPPLAKDRHRAGRGRATRAQGLMGSSPVSIPMRWLLLLGKIV
jgi:hypothetical protein